MTLAKSDVPPPAMALANRLDKLTPRRLAKHRLIVALRNKATFTQDESSADKRAAILDKWGVTESNHLAGLQNLIFSKWCQVVEIHRAFIFRSVASQSERNAVI